MYAVKNEKYILYILAFVSFIHIMDFMIVMPMGDMIMKIFDISPRQFSIIVASYTIFASISSFAGAFWIDRFDRKKAILISYIGFIIGTILCGLAPNYEILVLMRSITGLFGGCVNAIVLSIIADLVPFERRGAAMGIVMSAFPLASALGVPFGMFIADLYSWHAPFLFLGIGGAGVIFLLNAYIPQMNAHLLSKSERQTPAEVLKMMYENPNRLRASLLLMLLITGHFLIIPSLNPYLVNNVGFTQKETIYVYMVGGGMMFFVARFIGKLTDRFGSVLVMTCLLTAACVPIFALTNMPKVPVGVVLIFSTMFFVFSGGRMIPAQTMISGLVEPKFRGTFMSLQSSINQLGTATASVIGGMMITQNPQTKEILGFVLLGYLAVFMTIMAIFLARSVKITAKKLEI